MGEMFTVQMDMGSTAESIVSGQLQEEIEEAYDQALNRSILQLENIIKRPGYAPRSGHGGQFAAAHHANLEVKLTKTISNSLRVSNGEFLWKYIIGGHRTLTTLKARRWWFWYLKNKLGGDYTRKTPGQSVIGAGGGAVSYVPPDDYVNRAVTTLISSQFIDQVVSEEIGKLLGASTAGPVNL